MKAMQEHIDFPMQSAVKVKWQKKKHFTYPWHFHNEIEILYVLEGSGTSFVADSIESFNPGDLAILGSNLPHFWRSDEKYYDPSNEEQIDYIVIQFSSDLLPESMFQYAEFSVIQQLFIKASRGLRFKPSFAGKAGKLIINLADSSGLERVILLLQLLNEMARTDDYKILAGELYKQHHAGIYDNRLAKVMNFLNIGYKQKIELKEIAELANLHPSSFCRYFKEKTGKSLSEYITELRLSYACRLITEGKMSISQVCFESGFNNLSNFNRIFKRTVKMTPSEYFYHFHRR